MEARERDGICPWGLGRRLGVRCQVLDQKRGEEAGLSYFTPCPLAAGGSWLMGCLALESVVQP